MFSKKPEAETRPMPRSAAPSSQGTTFSVLGSDTKITGDISASADLHIDGAIEGDISCASLVQGESSEISGAIQAESARLAGTVRGSVDARDLVILQSAHIEGDLEYDSLTIEQGAKVDGKLSPRGSKPVPAETPQPVNESADKSDADAEAEAFIFSDARAG